MRELTRSRYLLLLALSGGCVLAVILVSPGIGSRSHDFGAMDAWRAWARGATDSSAYYIGLRLRLPRTLLALEAGITLALCGAVFQVLFRNALATPYTLGISSGGSLGALIAIKLGWEVSLLGLSSVSLAAFAGSMAVVAVVLLFTRGSRRLTTNELLLAGVTLGMFCSAMMMFVTYLSDARQTFEMIRWMMGSLDTIGHFETTTSLPLILPAWVVLIGSSRSLNQYVLGDELAAARGVNLPRLQLVCVLVACLAVSAVVAVCGPIGFVGLVVPHVVALIVGSDARLLLPASALMGGVFLAVCDWLSQLVMAWCGALTGRELSGVVLPIGVMTAVLGVPIFLVLLHRRALR